ncbi:hypothetical protein LRM36_05355 [Stenotrophomonas maltophilia]|nr:hypothetical protein [Stenotrophomonas maltophilia]
MNKDNAKDYLPLVQALAEGKVIQMFDGKNWEDLEDVAFSYELSNYRVKPEPREVVLTAYENGSVVHRRYREVIE